CTNLRKSVPLWLIAYENFYRDSAAAQQVVGVSEIKNNLVAEGVRLVKNFSARRAKFQDIDQRERVAAADAENLSGIDDSEVVGYLNNTKEIHYKKIIWEKMNKEFAKFYIYALSLLCCFILAVSILWLFA
ncbi:hypothetical protein HAX54_045921, partial [Datura stramonium]|nr:hypothetical protein [Datura stramonium]